MSYLCEFKLFETLIWAETERERGAGKITSCHVFPRRKTGTNFHREATPPPPLELSGSAHACLTVEFFIFIFLHVAYFLKLTDYAGAQADLRLCCLHATKSSFSQHGSYGMG